MKVRIIVNVNKFYPQWKGKLFWRYFYEDEDKIWCTNEKDAEKYLKEKSWIKKSKIIKEFEV